MPPQRAHSDDDMGGGIPLPGEIKPQKACVNCRRSKVKCIHEGGPPCRRCMDTKQECKFRLRADDETWRERTDETLSKLSYAVDALLHRTTGPMENGNGMQGGYNGGGRPSHPRTPSFNGPGSNTALMGPPQPPLLSPAAASMHSSHSGMGGGGGGGPSRGMGMQQPPHQSPSYSDPMPDFQSPDGPTSDDVDSRSMGRSPGPKGPGGHHRLSSSISYGGGGGVRKREEGDDGGPVSYRSPSSGPAGYGPGQRPRIYSMNGTGPAGVSSHIPSSGPSTAMAPPLPPAHLDPDQTMPSPALVHVTSSSAPFYLQGYGYGAYGGAGVTGVRWMMGCTTSYAKATYTIGQQDPRLNAISMGLVQMEKARSLFVFFSERLQPHSFGFPTYPADGNMTPIIISAIMTVATLHDPSGRQCHATLKNDLLASIKPEQQITENRPLDPELGIGVEEITGACIAAAWLGGEVAWRISRVARWWCHGYLRNWDIPRAVTLGECLTILPPFRQIDLVDKLRIWLGAYIAEAQQAFILDRPSLYPSVSPATYIDALRNAFNEPNPAPTSNGSGNANGSSSNGSANGGSANGHDGAMGGAPSPGGGRDGSAGPSSSAMANGAGPSGNKIPPPPDRQLIAHASLMAILLYAQKTQRESRWAAESGGLSSSDAIARLLGNWCEWFEELEKWKAEARSMEDLSASTMTAMDITLVYHLARAHLGSLTLEPESSLPPSASSAAQSDHRLQVVQQQCINALKTSACAALELASSKAGFADRLSTLPSIYHFLLSHAVGVLLLLIQRKWRFLMAGEARSILDLVDTFVRLYVYEISAHSMHPNADQAPHPSRSTAESLARALGHVKAQTRAT